MDPAGIPRSSRKGDSLRRVGDSSPTVGDWHQRVAGFWIFARRDDRGLGGYALIVRWRIALMAVSMIVGVDCFHPNKVATQRCADLVAKGNQTCNDCCKRNGSEWHSYIQGEYCECLE